MYLTKSSKILTKCKARWEMRQKKSTRIILKPKIKMVTISVLQPIYQMLVRTQRNDFW